MSDYVTLYKAMKKTFQSEYKERSPLYKERLVKWAAEPPITRIDGPTNIARARELGYKAKQGVVMARVQVLGGKSKRVMFSGGRKPSKRGMYFTRQKSGQSIAEERAGRRFTNCEVLNSYFVGQSGSTKFYEVILIDRANPVVQSDPGMSAILSQRNRAVRGLTRSGRKHRGLRTKGFGTARFRPSKRANNRS